MHGCKWSYGQISELLNYLYIALTLNQMLLKITCTTSKNTWFWNLENSA